MQITVETRNPVEVAVDLLVIALAELDRDAWRPGTRIGSVDRALSGQISAVIASGDTRLPTPRSR